MTRPLTALHPCPILYSILLLCALIRKCIQYRIALAIIGLYARRRGSSSCSHSLDILREPHCIRRRRVLLAWSSCGNRPSSRGSSSCNVIQCARRVVIGILAIVLLSAITIALMSRLQARIHLA